MTDDRDGAITGFDVAALDGSYEPIPTFAEWTAAVRVDSSLYEHHKAMLVGQREAAGDDAFVQAAAAVIRAAAFDTGAIEGLYDTNRGFTFSVVAHQALTWERQVESRSDIALPLFKAQLEAYELLLDAATGAFPTITEAWLRSVHDRLCSAYPYYEVRTASGSIQVVELPLGTYKIHPNHVLTVDGSTHSYAPVSETPIEMGRLVAELNEEAFGSAHPVIQAAYAHYCLVRIHPFADGNGRVARAVASTYIYRAVSLPLVVLVDHRTEYLESLERADAGEFQAFVDFCTARLLDAMELVVDALSQGVVPDVHSSVALLRDLLTVGGGVTVDQLDDIAQGLLQQLAHVVNVEMEGLQLPPGVQTTAQLLSGAARPDPPDGWRNNVKHQSTYLWCRLLTTVPVQVAEDRNVFAFLAKDRAMPMAIRLAMAEDRERRLDFRVDEFHPVISATAQLRLQQYGHMLVGLMAAGFSSAVDVALRGGGYR